MKVANIYPIANQKFYKKESYTMILAHLVKEGLYDPSNFSNKQFIIMDNGLFEKAQVSTNLQDLIDLAEGSGIPVSEIVIPDAVNDPFTTMKLFKENKEIIRKYSKKYSFMFVCQAKTFSELGIMIDFIHREGNGLNITIGISKLSPLPRDSNQAIQLYKKCKFPIHFLGIKLSFSELLNVRGLIRGTDTSQLAFMVKNDIDVEHVDIINYSRIGEDIDLAVDDCNEKKLKKLLEREQEAFRAYGILR